jgi:hypothetical protein
MFTRFHDDPCRIVKQLQQQTDPGRWILDTPGPGASPAFTLDPQMIAQKWGGNYWTEMTNLESRLQGYHDNPRDCLSRIQKPIIPVSHPIDYPTQSWLTTDQSRATQPAWLLRDQPATPWVAPPVSDTGAGVEFMFSRNINTRQEIKDTYEACRANNSTNAIDARSA